MKFFYFMFVLVMMVSVFIEAEYVELDVILVFSCIIPYILK